MSRIGIPFFPRPNVLPPQQLNRTRIQRGNAPLIAPPPHVISPTGGQSYTKQLMKVLKLDLTIARTDQLFYMIGTIIWLYTMYDGSGNNDTTDIIKIRIGDINADQLRWGAGNGIEGTPFDRIYVTNAAISGITAELAYFQDTPDKPVRFF